MKITMPRRSAMVKSTSDTVGTSLLLKKCSQEKSTASILLEISWNFSKKFFCRLALVFHKLFENSAY